MRPALEARAEDVLAADGVVLGTTANFGELASERTEGSDRPGFSRPRQPFFADSRTGRRGSCHTRSRRRCRESRTRRRCVPGTPSHRTRQCSSAYRLCVEAEAGPALNTPRPAKTRVTSMLAMLTFFNVVSSASVSAVWLATWAGFGGLQALASPDKKGGDSPVGAAASHVSRSERVVDRCWRNANTFLTDRQFLYLPREHDVEVQPPRARAAAGTDPRRSQHPGTTATSAGSPRLRYALECWTGLNRAATRRWLRGENTRETTHGLLTSTLEHVLRTFGAPR